MLLQKLLTFILVLFILFRVSPTPIIAQETPALRFSVDKLQMKGVIGEDTFTATFHLLSATQEVKNVKLLASDLVAASGVRITGSQYQLSPNAFTTIPANNGETVTVSINQVPATGTYSGTIEVLYTGSDSQHPLLLNIEVQARAKATLELAKDSAQVNISAARPLLPYS